MCSVMLWKFLSVANNVIPLQQKKKQKQFKINDYEKDFLDNGCNVGNVNGFGSPVLQLWMQ